MQKSFEEVVKKSIGKNIKLFLESVGGSLITYEGRLVGVNSDYFEVRDDYTKTSIFINMKVNTLLGLEVID